MPRVKRNIDISTDMKKLKKVLNEIPKERQPVVTNLFNELVFMQNTLETLKQQVREEGATTGLEQGNQKMKIIHPALKAYNTTIQRFNATYKQIIDLLPVVQTQDTDELETFLQG